jgi:hypothetical protein
VNEYGPPPDWESVFHRARRRMFGRLLLVAVLAALGAGLLLNGGLAAQGAAPWLPINKATENKPEHEDKHRAAPHERHRQHRKHSDDGHRHPGHKGKQAGHKKDKRHKRDKCDDDSAGTQYCDAPPTTPDVGPTGNTDTSAGDVAKGDEVAPTGVGAPTPED